MIGRALARGASLERAIVEAKLRVEAVDLVPRIARWAEERGVRAPIFQAIARGVLTGHSPEALLRELMAAPPQRLS